jgi:carboxylate-amine ligase
VSGTGEHALSVGVEEEFLLLDPESGTTVPAAETVLRLAGAPSSPGATLQPELRATQVEAATGVCRDGAELTRHLLAGRDRLAGAARSAGLLLVASGTPPLGRADTPGTGTVRFARIDEIYTGVVDDYEACGCHVHVGVPDREKAVAVVNHLRPWLPTLLAVSANSPFIGAQDSGYASWRMVQQSRFPGAGVPPFFSGHREYRETVERLIDCGALVDDRMTFWLARPSPTLPTVEVRAADVAITAEEALAQALLTRALVRTALTALERGEQAGHDRLVPHLAPAAVWSAARHGLDGPGVDLRDGRRRPAGDLLDDLLDHVGEALAGSGDHEVVHRVLSDIRSRGTGARRQREAARGGLDRLPRTLAAETVGHVRERQA